MGLNSVKAFTFVTVYLQLLIDAAYKLRRSHPLLTKTAEPGGPNLQQKHTVFSVLNAGGVYLKLDLVDPAFIRGPVFIN